MANHRRKDTRAVELTKATDQQDAFVTGRARRAERIGSFRQAANTQGKRMFARLWKSELPGDSDCKRTSQSRMPWLYTDVFVKVATGDTAGDRDKPFQAFLMLLPRIALSDGCVARRVQRGFRNEKEERRTEKGKA